MQRSGLVQGLKLVFEFKLVGIQLLLLVGKLVLCDRFVFAPVSVLKRVAVAERCGRCSMSGG